MYEKSPPNVSILFGILAILLSITNVKAQTSNHHQHCGTKALIEKAYNKSDFKAFAKSFKTTPFRSTIEVPVKLHIVQDDNGISSLTEEDALTNLAEANELFAESGLQFVSCGSVHLISSSEYFDLDETEEANLLKKYNVKNVVNIYYFNTIILQYTLLCGYASFPWMDEEYVMMANDCTDNGNILAHELGHYLGLYHTHAQLYGLEHVDGSNCDEAGDLLCDTPADPYLGWHNVNQDCEYIGYEIDPKGKKYTPHTKNIMSYSIEDCRIEFTEDQYTRMHYYLQNDRSDLHCVTVFPDLTSSSMTIDKAKLRAGSDLQMSIMIENIGDTLATHSELHLYLSKDENFGAGDIFITENTIHEMDKAQSSSFVFDVEIPLSINSGEYYLLSCLDNEYQIDELNENNNCTYLPVKIDNSELGIWNLHPNPVRDEAFLFFKHPTKGLFDIKIYSVDMREIYSKSQYKFGEELFLNFDTSDFNRGLYFVVLTRKDEVFSFKFAKM